MISIRLIYAFKHLFEGIAKFKLILKINTWANELIIASIITKKYIYNLSHLSIESKSYHKVWGKVI
jgi:hypothetical protein